MRDTTGSIVLAVSSSAAGETVGAPDRPSPELFSQGSRENRVRPDAGGTEQFLCFLGGLLLNGSDGLLHHAPPPG